MHTIELPPYAPTLIESTRAIGYSLDAAIADIIDNSIAACSKNIEVTSKNLLKESSKHGIIEA